MSLNSESVGTKPILPHLTPQQAVICRVIRSCGHMGIDFDALCERIYWINRGVIKAHVYQMRLKGVPIGGYLTGCRGYKWLG